jgi:tetratricopeptide (TPR) repeat protein
MLLSFLLVLQLGTLSPVDSYNEANRLYEEGDYTGAIERYEEALLSSRDSRLFFNLGNAYFKSGRVGKAVVNYRRARLLSPRDPDIRANLDFTRSYRADKVETRTNPLIAILTHLLQFFSVREAFLSASILFFLGFVLLSAAVVRRQRWLGYAALGIFLIFLYFFFSWGAWRTVLGGRGAAVVVPETTAYSGPGHEYREVLKVHDGLEVRIKDERRGFALVQIPGGLGGWVEENAVEEVLPDQK